MNPVAVEAEEKHRLAECCAFFKAEAFRPAEPGAIRKADVQAAEAEIEQIVDKVTRPSAKRRGV